MPQIFIPGTKIERNVEEGDLLLIVGQSHKGRYANLGVFKEPIQIEDPCGVILSRSYLLRANERLGGVQFPVIIPQRVEGWFSLVTKKDLVVGQESIVETLKRDDEFAIYAAFVEKLKKPYLE